MSKYWLISQEEVEKIQKPFPIRGERKDYSDGFTEAKSAVLSKAKLVDSDESVKVEIGYPSPKVSDFIVQPKEPQWLDKPKNPYLGKNKCHYNVMSWQEGFDAGLVWFSDCHKICFHVAKQPEREPNKEK